jgi:hypothetical protein
MEEFVYRSVAVPPMLAKVELANILASARRRNLADGITGMLLYYRGEFVQILEGKKQSVDKVYQNHIGPDARHSAISIVCQNPIASRSFSQWTMGFVGPEDIESGMPFSLAGVLMSTLTTEAKRKSLSKGVACFVSIYNTMRKSA